MCSPPLDSPALCGISGVAYDETLAERVRATVWLAEVLRALKQSLDAIAEVSVSQV